MLVMALGTEPPAPSSPGKATTTATKPAAVDGSLSEQPAASSVTSSSIRPTIQASSANANDLFNGLLGDVPPWIVSAIGNASVPSFLQKCVAVWGFGGLCARL